MLSTHTRAKFVKIFENKPTTASIKALYWVSIVERKVGYWFDQKLEVVRSHKRSR